MAELEIHHEGHEPDGPGKAVGVLAAVLAVFLAVVTIASHRTHTEAIIKKSESNDQWGYYQATRLKLHNLELGERLTRTLGAPTAATQASLAEYGPEKKKYEAQGKELQAKALEMTGESEAAEHRALRYDLGEGLLEIGLVLSSLYFIARKMLFPTIGIIAGLAGVVAAVAGFLM
jgi:hypothetical protein